MSVAESPFSGMEVLRSVCSRYDLSTTNALQQRLCYLGIVNIGAPATLPLRSWRSGQLQALFKCSPKVGVALFDSRTNLECFHSHVIEESRDTFDAHCSY